VVRRSERLHRAVFWLGVAAAVGMLVVLVMGARVTSTGSAQGCGRDWPLCNGKLVPDLTFAAAIEFSHRAVTGIEGVLIVALTVAVLALYRDQRPIQVLAPLMLGFLLLQAGMGAAAVKYPEAPVVLARHFGISLIALASTALTALYIRRPGAMLAAPAVSRGLRAATWGGAVYLYVLVYSGAYVRHVGAASACPSWPACGGGGASVAVDLLHRFAAGLALVVAVALFLAYRRAAPGRRDLLVGASVLVAALVAQGGAGAYLVLSGFALSAELLHSALTGVAFTAAAYLCLLVTLGARAVERPAAAPSRLRSEGAT
jgi:cytochrome c oxidase assembly protein subunit 15